MKYKPGDKVKIKSLEWYQNAVRDKDGCVECKLRYLFLPEMSKYCGDVMTIEYLNPAYDPQSYAFAEDDGWSWTDEMIECLVEPAPVMINLDKACEYLEDVLYEVATGVTCEPDVMSVESTTMENFINNFRKAMEE